MFSRNSNFEKCCRETWKCLGDAQALENQRKQNNFAIGHIANVGFTMSTSDPVTRILLQMFHISRATGKLCKFKVALSNFPCHIGSKNLRF